MSTRKTIAIAAATLVLGLAVGAVGTASAASSSPTTGSATVAAQACDLGLRLGATLRESGGRLVDVVAKLTGLSTDEIHDKRVAGESFAQIAESEGVSADKVVDEALDARKALLAEKVKDGTITQQQADEALTRMESRLEARVSSTQPGGMGRGMGGGMGRGRGTGGGGCGGAGGGCGGACAATPQAPAVQ